jgi:effector-binding domain-containing protein
VVENDSIFQKMNFNNSESIISWKFKDTIGGTKVILKSSGTMPFLFRIKALLNGSLEKSIKEIYSKNLVNLGNSLDYEINNYSIKVNGFTTNNGGNYMKQTITSKISNLERNIKIMLPRLTRFFKKNKVTMNGSPFIIYNTYDERNGITNFSVCIPIKEEIITSSGSDITSGSLAPYKAIKTTLIGDYSHVQEAWKKTLNYISKNKIPRNNSIPVLEIYKTGVDQERKPSKWVTEIYVAVQATKVIDTVSLKKVTISKPTISNEQ